MGFNTLDYNARRQRCAELFKKWRDARLAELGRGIRVPARDLVAEVLVETGLAQKSLANMLAIFGYRLDEEGGEFFVRNLKPVAATPPQAPPQAPPLRPPEKRSWFGGVRFD